MAGVKIRLSVSDRLRLLLMKLRSRERYKAEKSRLRLSLYSSKARAFNDNFSFPFSSRAALASFKHSGHTGDVIYSLPTVFALAESASIHLNCSTSSQLPPNFDHPYGKEQLPERVAHMLAPLLLTQKRIQSVQIWSNDTAIDFDLDLFRDSPQDLGAGSISHWYFPIFGVAPDISVPWIELDDSGQCSGSVVLARSSRYRNDSLDYGFLKKYPNLKFVGLESEFLDMRKTIPNIEFIPVANFLELGQVIRSASLFIGNQSFPYSLAEAMKVPRILEQCLYAPNVIPVGGVAHPALFQKQFEYVASRLIAPALGDGLR